MLVAVLPANGQCLPQVADCMLVFALAQADLAQVRFGLGALAGAEPLSRVAAA